MVYTTQIVCCAIKIQIYGNKARLLGEQNHRVIDSLDLFLSFRPAGIEFSPSVKSGRWDGRTRLLSKSLEFPVGLVDSVASFYKDFGQDVEIENLNKSITITSKDISSRLKEIGKDPRYYQIDAANTAIEKKRGIIRSCTGSGKTLIAALIIAKVNRPAIVYVIGKDLLWQFHRFFTDIFQTDIGVIGDGVCQIKDITIASIWSVGKAFGMGKVKNLDDEGGDDEKDVSESYYRDITSFVSRAEVSILDECHLAASETVQRIGANFTGEYVIGMSASPYRDDNADLLIEAIFGRVIVDISASSLIADGFLVQPIIRFLNVPKFKFGSAGKTYKEIYKNYIVNNDDRNDMVIKGGIKLVEQNFTTMVLFKEIEHGNKLYKGFLDKGMNCYLLNGKLSSDKRKAAVDEVIAGKCKLLLASSIFDIGVDIPNLSGLVLAGSGKSSVRAIQRIGRAIRPYPNKTIAAILEFDDKAKYLKEHAEVRKKIYRSEPGFIIQ